MSVIGMSSVFAEQISDANTIKIRVLALDKHIDQKFYFFDGNDYFSPRFSQQGPSIKAFPVTVFDDWQLPIYKKKETDEGEVYYQVYLRIVLPAGSKQVLIISSKLDNVVSMVAVEDNFSQNDRDWLLINTTAVPLAFRMGNESRPLPLPPNESVPFQIEVEAGKGAVVRIAAYNDPGWKLIYSTFWPVYEGQRGLIVFMQSGERVVVRNFYEPVD